MKGPMGKERELSCLGIAKLDMPGGNMELQIQASPPDPALPTFDPGNFCDICLPQPTAGRGEGHTTPDALQVCYHQHTNPNTVTNLVTNAKHSTTQAAMREVNSSPEQHRSLMTIFGRFSINKCKFRNSGASQLPQNEAAAAHMGYNASTRYPGKNHEFLRCGVVRCCPD